MDSQFDFQQPKACTICNNFYGPGVFRMVSPKAYYSSIKYLHSAIIEHSNFHYDKRDTFSSSDIPLVVCPQCYDSTLRLAELNDEMESIQKSIYDFLLTFSMNVLHRRTKTKICDLPNQGTVEIDVCKFPDILLGESDLQVDPLQVTSHEGLHNNEEVQIEDLDLKVEAIDEFITTEPDLNENESHAEMFVIPSALVNKPTKRGKPKALDAFISYHPIQMEDNLTMNSVESVPSHHGGNVVVLPNTSLVDKPMATSTNTSTFRKYKCSTCGKSYSQHLPFERHLTSLGHGGERPYTCSTCERSFKTMAHLKKHNLAHVHQKSHNCPHCEKSFSSHDGLVRHIRVHTGEKPYSCPHCPLTFSASSNRVKHIRKYHASGNNMGNRRPYKARRNRKNV